MKKAVIFDLDGTLIDSIDDLGAALNHALAKHGFKTHNREAVLSFVGNGVGRLVSLGMGKEQDDPMFPTVFEDFRAYYTLHNTDLTHPYEGIEALLAALAAKGIKTAVVSNKYDAAVKALAGRFFGDLIPLAIGETPTLKRKPEPDSVLFALETLGVSPDEAYFVGDSEVDVETARRAGIECLTVLWGFRSREELIAAGATRFFEAPCELQRFLTENP